MSIEEYERLNHSVWECKYHVVFIPKYRKKEFFGVLRNQVGKRIHSPPLCHPREGGDPEKG